MSETRELAEDAMKRVMILLNLIEDMHQNVEALKKITRFPDGVIVGHDLVVYQVFEVRAIMDDLLATIPE
jgi:hypothetical protein